MTRWQFLKEVWREVPWYWKLLLLLALLITIQGGIEQHWK